MDDSFQEDLDAFVEYNCKLFADAADYYPANGSVDNTYLEPNRTRGHQLRHFECYTAFQSMIDDKMNIFLANEKCSRRIFMSKCRDAVLAANRGEDGIGVVFVELLLASSDYESFCVMMAHEAKEQIDQTKD